MLETLTTMLKRSGHYEEGEELRKTLPYNDGMDNDEKVSIIAYASICAFYQLLDTDRVIGGADNSGGGSSTEEEVDFKEEEFDFEEEEGVEYESDDTYIDEEAF